MRVAVLVDGAFFLFRAKSIWGNRPADEMASILEKYCRAHVQQAGRHAELYRIFYYDCPPADINAVNPVSKKNVHYIHTKQAGWRIDFQNALKRKRKLALRLGKMDERNPRWILSSDKLKALCNRKITVDDLTENDVTLDIRQKGVDMKIGLDIATIAFKKLADQIILISGDSDFVYAAKHARREGIDFILDPMWAHIKEDLMEHIDGLQSQVENPETAKIPGKIKFHTWPPVRQHFTGELKQQQNE